MAGHPPKCDLDPKPVKTLIFDLMGTCLDWHSAVSPVLEKAFSFPEGQRLPFTVAHWRWKCFEGMFDCYEAGRPQEDIDETRRRSLVALIHAKELSMDEDELEACVQAWHSQIAWPDVTVALPLLRSKFNVIVLANGTTRNQIDMTKSSGLSFDTLLSSELLGLSKPDPAIYLKAMGLLKCKPEECMMVAAHAEDLSAAKGVGMRTAYIQRWSEDWSSAADGSWEETHLRYRDENDVFIDGRVATGKSGGFLELAKMLGL